MRYKKTKANKERAERIAATVEAYDEEDNYSSMIDLLTDLRHYARQNKFGFDDALAMSENHFEAEAGGES